MDESQESLAPGIAEIADASAAPDKGDDDDKMEEGSAKMGLKALKWDKAQLQQVGHETS